jgi:hypothetical protein
MVQFTGAPLGGFVGGLAVSALLAHFGWQVIFVIGGVFPLALVPVMALWLPESPRFLAHRRNLSTREQALLACLDITPARANSHSVDIAAGNPVKMRFGRGYALQTMLLWVIYFCSLLNLFLFVYWLPEVLHLTGMTPSPAVFASSIIPLGGMSAVLYLGLLIDRFGPERALALHYAAGIVFIALIALVALAYFALLAVIFFAGTTIIGSQTGAKWGVRRALPGAHAHYRDRLGDRHWPPGQHRLADIGRLSAGARLAADTDLLERVFLCIGGGDGDGPARIARETRYAARAAIRTCALALAPNRLTLSEACVAPSNVSETARRASGRRRQWRS